MSRNTESRNLPESHNILETEEQLDEYMNEYGFLFNTDPLEVVEGLINKLQNTDIDEFKQPDLYDYIEHLFSLMGEEIEPYSRFKKFGKSSLLKHFINLAKDIRRKECYAISSRLINNIERPTDIYNINEFYNHLTGCMTKDKYTRAEIWQIVKKFYTKINEPLPNYNRTSLNTFIQNLSELIASRTRLNENFIQTTYDETINAFGDFMKFITFTPIITPIDYNNFFIYAEEYITNIINTQLLIYQQLKISYEFKCLIKDRNNDIVERNFRMGAYNASRDTRNLITNFNDITNYYNQMTFEIVDSINNMNDKGSGGEFITVVFLKLKLFKIDPLFSGSFLETPEWIKSRKATVNIKNKNDKCFIYSVLCALFYEEIKNKYGRLDRPQFYEDYENYLNLEGITMPISDNLYALFEKNNKISINVLSTNIYDDLSNNKPNEIIKPEYVSLNKYDRTINLLRLYNEEKSHFIYIRDINSLFKKCKTNSCYYFCVKCFNSYSTQEAYDNHIHNKKCVTYNVATKIMYPEQGENKIEKFTLTKKYEKVNEPSQILIYYDIEASIENNEHKAIALGCYVNYVNDGSKSHYKSFYGYNCIKSFLSYIFSIDVNKNKHIPVIAHNSKNYDNHFIINNLGDFYNNVSITPSTTDKYLSIKVSHYTTGHIKNFKFIDSRLFYAGGASLSALSKSLKPEDFIIYNRYIPDIDKSKGAFPYTWLDSINKCDEKALPDINAYFNDLTNTPLSKEEYEYELQIFNNYCDTFKDYLLLYLKRDVLLLADIFNTYIRNNIKNFGIDPTNYITVSSYGYDMMKSLIPYDYIETFDNDNFDIIADLKKNIRGGLTMAVNRYAKANNKYMSSYNPNEESSFIQYLDANSLYPTAMSMRIPYKDYIKYDDIETINEYMNIDYSKFTGDEEEGFILMADIEIPEELHDFLNDYPLMPEHRKFEPSPVMNDYAKQHNIKTFSSVNKLVATLYNKNNYMLHYLNAKLITGLGCKITKIHYVLTFKQDYIFKPYIDKCATIRNICDMNGDKCGKDLAKIMMNAPYGKLLENIENHGKIEIINATIEKDYAKKFLKTTSKKSFKDVNVYNKLVCCEMNNEIIKYNQPILQGFTVLELSKYIMYNFHYNTMKKHFKDDIKLLYTDTDSLIYHIKCNDFYDFIKDNINQFDTSKMDKTHYLYNPETASKLGLFKSETEDIITEFIGLRAKTYSYITDNNEKINKNKGVPSHITKKIEFNKYLSCLYNHQQTRNKAHFKLIKSTHHKINTIDVNKVSLCSYDDKRYILDDLITSYAHGHKNTYNIIL